MKGLSGRIALVTGGTGLIGSAVVKRLAAEGAVVAVASRSAERARAWIHDAGDIAPGRLTPLELDLSDEDSIHAALERLRCEVGPPSLLIANASLRDGLATPFDALDHDSFRKLFDVDVAGHFLCARCLVEALPKETTASIVLLSSVYATIGVNHAIYPEGMSPTPVHYAAVKAGVLGMTRYLAGLWGERGVRVNAVAAGGVASADRQSPEFVRNYAARTMLRRMAAPEEIAGAVAFLASEEAGYITGECLVVDGGFSAW